MLRVFLLLALCWMASLATVVDVCQAADAIDTSKLPAAALAKIDFVKDVQPIFKSRCYSCHGSEEQESGLRLDSKKRAMLGGDNGRAILVGKSAESRLVHLVAGLDKEAGIMPPEGEGTPLTKDQLAMLRAWIDQGAVWPDDADADLASNHWSFQPIARPMPPKVANHIWVRNPIDAFVSARHESARVAPSREVDRATLIRRVYLDLLGLPPSVQKVNEFLADEREDAYEQLIDRTLKSEHYGERWGRHWLDLARYADSDGYEKDRARPWAYQYRDWVINALNADMPFDQFTIEQIAGDMLPDASLAQRVASGFHRNTLHNTEGGTDQEEDRVKKTVDRINTVSTIWLGLTVGCAQCHSHKYDPITQREYYQMYAFFNNINENDIEAPLPAEREAYENSKIEFAAEQKRLKSAVDDYVKNKLATAQADWEKTAIEKDDSKLPNPVADALAVIGDQRTKVQHDAIAKHYRSIDAELKKLETAVADHAKKDPQTSVKKAQAVVEANLRQAHIHIRGDFLSKGEPVDASTLSVLSELPTRGERPDRLDFAHWLMAKDNSLTARVTVNRIWQQYFGRGLVATGDDFGSQGDRSTHPELLDWLASEFRDSGWRMKHIHKLIVMSATYRQSSTTDIELVENDPANDLLARHKRRRVEAEIIRDLALGACGLLDRTIGGPSVRPPQPAEYSALTYANSAKWAESKGGDRFRRGLYTFFQRTSPYPMLITFDAPDGNECTAMRDMSNTPLQALTLLNDRVFWECAQALGRRVVNEVPAVGDASAMEESRAIYAFQLCVARRPDADELIAIRKLLHEQTKLCAADEERTTTFVGPSPVPNGVTKTELAGWIAVGRALINLDEFISR